MRTTHGETSVLYVYRKIACIQKCVCCSHAKPLNELAPISIRSVSASESHAPQFTPAIVLTCMPCSSATPALVPTVIPITTRVLGTGHARVRRAILPLEGDDDGLLISSKVGVLELYTVGMPILLSLVFDFC